MMHKEILRKCMQREHRAEKGKCWENIELRKSHA